MYDGCLAPKLHVVDAEESGSGLSSAVEFDVQGDGVRLVLRGEGRGEVCTDDG
jgi:hypothetical protein